MSESCYDPAYDLEDPREARTLMYIPNALDEAADARIDIARAKVLATMLDEMDAEQAAHTDYPPRDHALEFKLWCCFWGSDPLVYLYRYGDKMELKEKVAK